MSFQVNNKLSLAYKDKHLHDRWLRIIGVPLIGFFTSFSGKMYIPGMESENIFLLFLQMTCYTIVTWETCRRILLYNRKKYPGIKNTHKRIFKSFLFYTIGVMLITAFYVLLSLKLHFFVAYKWETFNIVLYFFVSLSITYSLGTIYEGYYFFRHWKKTTIETEQLKRESLQTQFESLKNQINPHFLFNSLNSLSSLIEEDAEKAEQFVQEMSEVYRYLLQSNEKPLTTLGSELKFLEAYFFLLRTRFSTNLNYEINVPKSYLGFFIPPLTLQILIENAVKHNVISSVKPLKIIISINNNDELVVSNSLQLKTQPVISNKIGLSNISTKYKLLNQPDIVIDETEKEFRVRVPLIKDYYDYKTNEIENLINT